MVMLTDSGSDYKPIEAGAYAAVCSRVIDLGTQTTSYNGEEKSARKVLITCPGGVGGSSPPRHDQPNFHSIASRKGFASQGFGKLARTLVHGG